MKSRSRCPKNVPSYPMKTVLAKDLIPGKRYTYTPPHTKQTYDGVLQTIVEVGRGGAGFQEPTYQVVFENGTTITVVWDAEFSPK